MEKVWIYDKDPVDKYELEIHKILLQLTKNQELSRKGARILGLFHFLETNKFEDATKLRNSIFLDKSKKTKFFSKKDAEKIFSYFSEKIGGTGEGAFDALISRWVKTMFYMTPDAVQGPILMLNAVSLQNLEEYPAAGQALGLAVDVISQANKNLAKMAQTYTPILMGLAPIPEASTVGIVIGYMISTMFIFFNMVIFVSRQHYGQAFTQSLALFPFVGMALQSWGESADTLVSKFAAKRKALIKQLRESMFAGLGDVIESYTIDPEYVGDPKADAQKLKDTLNKSFENATSAVQTFADKIKDPAQRQAMLANAQAKVAEYKKLDSANTPAKKELVSELSGLVSRPATPVTPALGGKRLSYKIRSKSKWGTQRKLKM